MTKRYCRCGALASSQGRCDRCHKRNPKTPFATVDRDRYQTWRWRMLSQRIRKERALCETCLEAGRVTPSTECHHIVEPTSDRLMYDPRNVLALCHQCHNEAHETAMPHPVPGKKQQKGGFVQDSHDHMTTLAKTPPSRKPNQKRGMP